MERRMSQSTIHREPCSDTREGVAEASVSARVGRALSAETDMIRMCRGSSHGRRQYRVRRYGEAQPDFAASETLGDPMHARTPPAGTWEVFGSSRRVAGGTASGRRDAVSR